MNINFFLLWQGKLVSALGDVVYEIALGFWILKVTGSTALMGSLMAASAIPTVILSPFAGVWVDRLDRKWLIVAMDIMRGAAVVLVGVAAISGHLMVWMVFAAGIVIGLGAAFFNPAVNSVIPDLVEKEDNVRANSFISMTQTGSNIVGSTAGGFLYNLLGAPLMFLLNGISYLFSAFTEIFMSVPKVHHPEGKKHFWHDMKDGLGFAWSIKGLRLLFVIAGFLNFFAFVAIILVLPLFQKSPELGPVKYGIAMAGLTTGMFAGMLFTAIVHIAPEKRFFLFGLGLFSMSIFWALFPLWKDVLLMILLLFTGGFFNSIVNVLINSVIQLRVPQNMRGKVFGFLNTLSTSLTPIAMATGGILGEFFPIKYVISLSFLMIGIFSIPLVFSRSLKEFISYQEVETEK